MGNIALLAFFQYTEHSDRAVKDAHAVIERAFSSLYVLTFSNSAKLSSCELSLLIIVCDGLNSSIAQAVVSLGSV